MGIGILNCPPYLREWIGEKGTERAVVMIKRLGTTMQEKDNGQA